MTKSEIEQTLKKASESLFTNQPDILVRTNETSPTEWNLGHHLANELQPYFPNYNCDLDVIKIHFEFKRPDIIFHKRGVDNFNFLVIELKRDGDDKDCEDDKKKIEAFWFRKPLCYQYGAIVNLKSNMKHTVEVLENPNGRKIKEPPLKDPK